jgi:hypothetical protein
MIRKRLLLTAALLTALATACGGPREPRAAPVPPREVGAFLVRLGNDTVAVEEFTRTPGRMEGRQVLRTPRTSVRDYTAELRPDGTLQSFDVRFRPTLDGEVTTHARIDFGADTAVVRVTRGGAEQSFRIPAPAGSIPFLSYSIALYELPIAYLRNVATDSLVLAQVPIGGPDAFPLVVASRGADSAVVRNLAGENRLRIDESGRVLGWDGRGSTLALAAERLAVVDLADLAREFAARDAAERGLGSLSPRDSLSATIGSATISVVYGRPLARGRQIFGNIVPWDQVWRTGANQATVLRTDHDLVIGGTPVPAGSYSLFTVPGREGWQLIINRQTGQWGTAHDPAQDMARIPMTRETLPQRLEQFTITIEPAGPRAGVLRLAWDDARATVPLQLR